MPNVRIRDIHGKDHYYENKQTLRVRDADNPGQFVEFTYKNGTLNVANVGETDCGEFSKVNVTVEEYTQELKDEMEDAYTQLGNLIDTIIATDEVYINDETDTDETDN